MDPTNPPVKPRRATDETGRLLPITEEELRIRDAEAIKALDDIWNIGTEEDHRQALEYLAEALGPERFRLDR
jgi:uncharacterized protein (UPF0147 family)